jgi:hypothetical protein
MLMTEEVDMRRRIFRITAVVISVLALVVAFGKLLRHPKGRDMVRAFNRRVLNPLMLKKAGRGNWYASTIETTGRKTALTRQTPVIADPVVGGFIIPLPYGTEVDWLRNAIAAGAATVHRHGVAYPVDRFEVMTGVEAAPLLSNPRRTVYRLTGSDRFLRTHLADSHLTVVG